MIPVDHLLYVYYCMSKCKLTLTMDCMSEIKGEEKMCIDPNLVGFTSSHSSDLFLFFRLQPKVLTVNLHDDQGVWFLALIAQIKAIFFRFWSSEKWTLIAGPWCEIDLLRIQLRFLIWVWNKKYLKANAWYGSRSIYFLCLLGIVDINQNEITLHIFLK